ncbi:DUF4402 domain-containing protein [Niveispirillum lacus]|nr:DUF4402 domain-containing protein [Niveispirillum lacus]
MPRFLTRLPVLLASALLWAAPSLAADPDVVLDQGLSFGSVVHSGAGTVTVDTDGRAAYSGGVEPFRQGPMPREGRAVVGGDPGQAVTISVAGGGGTAALGAWTIDGLVVAVDGVQAPVAERSATGGVTVSLSPIPGAVAEVRIGGRLAIPSSQVDPGTMVGTVIVEATYE